MMYQDNNIIKATIFGISSAMAASIMALFVKLAAAHTTNSAIILSRFSISFIYILLILSTQKLRKKSIPIKSAHPFMHILRSVTGVLSMLLFYYALAYIPLVDGSLLVMTNTLFIPILAAIFLQQKTTVKNWLFIILGFIGVALIIKPGHELFNPASLLALAAGLSGAISILSIRELSKYDNPQTIMLYYFAIACLISGGVSIFNWQTPSLHTLIILLGVGIFGTIYQEFLIRASFYASAKIVSSLLYLLVVFSGLFDWLIWHHIPDLFSWLGIILVCLGSILVIVCATTETKSHP